MSALRLNVMFIKMKMVSITHVYIYVLKTEVRNESRIFDFYTISLSIIMIRRTVISIKIETMNHAILTSTNHVVQFTYQACSLLFKWKKKLSNEVTILLHLYSYTCVVIFCQRNLHDSQDHGLSSKFRIQSGLKFLLLQQSPPSPLILLKPCASDMH